MSEEESKIILHLTPYVQFRTIPINYQKSACVLQEWRKSAGSVEKEWRK